MAQVPSRKYQSRVGRWMTPDPAGLAAVDLTNPQSWNRYGGWRTPCFVEGNSTLGALPSRFWKGGNQEFQSDSGAESGKPAAAQVRKSSARADHSFLSTPKSLKPLVQKLPVS